MTNELLRRLASQLRAQWAGFLTIFLFLSAGAAYALPGRSTILSDDIVNGQVRSVDVADGSITSEDALALSAGDIAKNALGTGQVDEHSLGPVPMARQAGAGAGGSGRCEASSTYVDCGAVGLTLTRPGRLLVIAAVRTSTGIFVDDVRGPCRLEVDGAPIEASETYFKYDDEGEISPTTTPREGSGQQATLTAVSHVYPEGRHIVGVECSLIASDTFGDGGDVYAYPSISVVGLSDR